jgi:MFS family permease
VSASNAAAPGIEPVSSRAGDRIRESYAAVAAMASNPGLRRVQLALAGSETGNWMAVVTLSVVSFAQGGVTAFGLVFALRMLVPALAAPFLGLLGDRLPRKRVMVAADLTRVTLITAAAAVVYLGGPRMVVYVLFGLVAAAGTAFRPAQAALLPALAESPDELTAANAVASTIQSAASFVGPALGGILVATTQPATAFLVAAATFGWSAALLAGVHEPPRARAAGAPERTARAVFAQLGEGVRALTENRAVALLVGLIGAQVVVYGALLVYLVDLSFNAMHGGEKQYGILLSALGVGGLIGAAGSFGLIGSGLVRSFAFANALWSVPIALLALWQTPVAAFVLVAVIGLANTLLDVAGLTLLQRSVPDELLGRVFGIFWTIAYSGAVVGALVAPVLIHTIGLTAAMVATGLFLPASVVAGWPLLRRLETAPAPAQDRIDLLRGVPFLVLLPEPAIEHLANVLVPVHAAAGETVIRQGEAGDRFYVVARGEVEVAVDGHTVALGQPGSYFGEIALLRDVPRSATVTAPAGAELLALDRDEFLATVTGHAESAREADAVASARLGVARPALFSL